MWVLCSFISSPVLWADEAQDPVSPPTAPSVRFVQPVQGQIVGGVIQVVIQVDHGRRIAHVSLFRGEAVIGIDMEPPFEFQWDTRRLADGPSTLTAKALDAEFHEGRADRSVTVDNGPPSVSLVAPKDGASVVGEVPLTADAADRQGVRLVRFLVNGTLVSEVSRPPYTAPWDSNLVPNGRYTVQARVFDQAENGATSAPATVRVANFNRHPVLTPLAAELRIAEDVPWMLALEAIDPDGARDPLTYGAANLPPWAMFEKQTGVLRGTPPLSEASVGEPQTVYPEVRFEVCDPEPLCDSTQTAIVVMDRNRPPVVQPIADQILKEEEPLSIQVLVTDPDGDPIICKSKLLPKWATLNPSECLLKGTPLSLVASQEELTVVYEHVQVLVCDDEPLCTPQEFSITVTNVNQTPVWGALKPQEVDEGTRLAFEVSAFDADQERPVFESSSLPDGAHFVDLGDGTAQFSWTPRPDQSGRYDAVLSVTDGDLTSTAQIPVTVRERIPAIAGVIVDVDDNPVPDALVALKRGTQTLTETVTDQFGAYLFSGLKPGEYIVKPDYVPKRKFSTRATSLRGNVFQPAIQHVEMSAGDQRWVDFVMHRGAE